MNKIRERFWSTVDAVLYHPVIENFMYNPRVRLAWMKMTIFIIFCLCMMLNQVWLALIITFSLVMSQWGN